MLHVYSDCFDLKVKDPTLRFCVDIKIFLTVTVILLNVLAWNVEEH